jgi:quinol monooxygenase YgiN
MAQTAINAINLDIAPDQFDKFVEATKENAAASTKDPGCREFNIPVSKSHGSCQEIPGGHQ